MEWTMKLVNINPRTIWFMIFITILLGGDWNHGMDYDFPIILGRIILTDELHHFSEGLKRPTRHMGIRQSGL